MMRTKATIISFFLVFSLYLLYGGVVVPLVLPQQRTGTGNTDVSETRTDATREEIGPYLALFSEGDWERDPEKEIHLLQFGRTIVLFGKETIKGKTIELNPCTILLLPDDLQDFHNEEEFQKKIRQSMVLRTPQYAEIDFEKDFDLSKMPLPKMKTGRLWGKVTVQGNLEADGKQEDFYLQTENIEITEEPGITKIETLKDVRFSFGPHVGHGTGLALKIAQSDLSQPQAAGEGSSAQFQRLTNLRFVFPDEHSNATTIDVTCKGGFQFASTPDEQGWTASFYQNVEMARNNPDKTVDRLTAEEVHLTLKPTAQSIANGTLQFDNLEPALCVARGKAGEGGQAAQPARLSVKHDGDVTLVGDEIFFDIRKNFLSLSTRPGAGASPCVEIIVADQYTIRNEQCIQYTLGHDGAFGKFAAEGKGTLSGKVGTGTAAKEISLAWNEMQMAPNPAVKDQIILKLNKGISAKLNGFGSMTANQLELHYNFTSAGQQKSNLLLDHAVVKDNVLFETATGTCRVKQLNIFFTNMTPDGRTLQSRWMPQILTEKPPAAPRMGIVDAYQPILQVQHLTPLAPTQPVPLYSSPAGTVASPVRNAAPQRSVAPAPKSSVETQNLLGIKSSGGGKFVMTSDLMSMGVLVQNGQSSAVNVDFEGNVRITEQVSGSASASALEIVGDTVRIWNPADTNTQIKISGQAATSDAIFKGKGVELRAGELNISRADNMFWSPGAGRLVADTSQIKTAGTTPVNIAPGNADGGKLVVTWNKEAEMRCDGQVLLFFGMEGKIGNRVEVNYQTTTLWCNEMQITLNRKVMFFDDQSSVEPRAVRIQCAHKVDVQNRQFDANGKQKSVDRAKVEKIQYDVDHNWFIADGPGELNSVFLGSGQGFDINGTSASRNQNVQNTLNYMAIWSFDSMQGTFLGNNKKVDIRGRKVEAAYCPAANWEDRIGRENLAAARLKGYTLECGRLLVEEIPDPLNGSQSAMELTASETAIIEGSEIYGKAKAIKYNQAKEVISMDGNATIHVTNQGQPMSQTVESIRYNIKTRSVELLQSQGMSIN
ncbi:MAG: hypothetical protein LBI05_00855 [Planctomycetaceae bacterium]|nr:hypothetical protein [Planctomycetaceae bacterium]